MKEKAFKTFRQAFEGVLKEFAMQFEAQCLEIPCEMREKALKTWSWGVLGPTGGFHMDFPGFTWDFTWNPL